MPAFFAVSRPGARAGFFATAVLLAASAFAEEIRIDDFPSGAAAWRFVGGEEFPDAKGAVTFDAAEGRAAKGALHLAADFTGGGQYVGAWRELGAFDAGKPAEIRFWAKARGVTALGVRINDATGQCHQGGAPLKATADWQEVTLRIADFVGGEHWGGANDGRWHGAPTGLGLNIGVTKTGEAKKADLWIDDVRVISAPEGRPTIEAVRLAQPICRPAFGTAVTYRWQAAPMNRDYKVFVHVRGADGNLAFQADHDLPTPTSEWAGPVSYDETLALPADLAPGDYRIVAGLWNPRANARLPLTAGAGVREFEPGAYVVGTLRVAAGAPVPKLPPPSLDLAGYHVTFDEDFTGKLDVSRAGPATRWIAHTPWWGDFGDAAFADPRPDFPFTTKDGILRIEARRTDGRWESGLLASVDPKGRGFAQRFGYFEMRAKLPKGPGVWPAFWLASTRGLLDRTVSTAEIDVLEQYGIAPNVLHSTVHSWGPGNRHIAVARATLVEGMTDGFHRYGVRIEPDFLTFYFDGSEIWRTPTPEDATAPLYPLVNLALGSGWPIDKTPNPSVMEVDYVRVWSK